MDTDQQQVEQAHHDATTEAMRAAGVSTETGMYVDYFDFDDTRRVTLPDGRSWVEIQVLNEGARRKYLNTTNRDVTIERASGNAKMRVASGDDRHALLGQAIVDWDLFTRNGKTGEMESIRFSEQTLRKFLENSSPTIIDLIEKEVRKDNPWLIAEVEIEDIDAQIEELQDLRKKKVAESEGKGF